jgi:Icc protein
LKNDELEFLSLSLSEHSDKNAIIFLHHHVLPSGSTWLDKIGLKNADAFLKIVKAHRQVKVVVCGHVHQENFTKHAGVDYISTPSCSWQFARNSRDFHLDQLMPGYRYINLYENYYETKVIRLPYNSSLIPDLTSVGY